MGTAIDFVIPWVDGGDDNWKRIKDQYQTDTTSDDRIIRYRDWELLRYWFRGVEKNAPWVNKIHFVTYNQTPEWLNTNHPKLNRVNHEDYIPHEYLPTFNSHTIELNMHRIKGLSEQFVYFNDDVFVIKPVSPEDFFVDEMPCDCGVESGITPRLGEFSSILCENVGVINKHFTKADLNKRGRYKLRYRELNIRSLSMAPYNHIMGFYNPHIATSFKKSTLEEVWHQEERILDSTCHNRFRGKNDVSQYLFRYWNICTGNFVPRYPLGKHVNVDSDISLIEKAICSRRVKLLTLNDNVGVCDFEKKKREIIKLLEELFPEKSSFEK